MTQFNLNLTWKDDDGAEPSHIFDNFHGVSFLVKCSPPYDPIRIVWDTIVETEAHGYVIQGWIEDPETGEGGDPIDILLSSVESIEYL